MPINRPGNSAAPAMPATSVQNTPPSTGPSPIAPPVARGDTMGNTGLTLKDVLVIRQAVIKSTLESPLMAALAATKQDNEIPPMLLSYAEMAEAWVIRGIQNGVTTPF